MRVATDRADRVPARRQGRIVIRETQDGIGVYNPARREPLAIGFLSLWQLIGVEKLFLVSAGAIVVERGFRPFGRKKVYPVENVSSVGLMPDKPPEVSSIFAPRRIGFVVDGKTHSFGIGLDEVEAAMVLAELQRFVERFAPPEPDRTEAPGLDERQDADRR